MSVLGFRLWQVFSPSMGLLYMIPLRAMRTFQDTKGQNLIKGLPNACSMLYCKECATFKYYPNWFQPFDDEISFCRNPISFASLLLISGKGSSN